MPGLIDTHIHAPQYVYTGTGYDLPLLEWLKMYTFPAESRFSDKEFAQHAYKKVVVSCDGNSCRFANTKINVSMMKGCR